MRDRIEVWKQLDALGEQLGALPKENSEAVRLQITATVFELLYTTYPDKEEQISEFFLNTFSSFEAEKGKLSAFCSRRLHNQQLDDYREVKRIGERECSLEVSQPPEEEVISTELQFEQTEYFDALFGELLTMMLQLPERISGRANNPTRLNYWRMFFTDNISDWAKNKSEGADLKTAWKHEREVFAALKLEFLDYFMSEKCRTLLRLHKTPLKLLSQLTDAGAEKETPLPLPQSVYCSYLSRVEGYTAKASAVSQQKKAYIDFLREKLC